MARALFYFFIGAIVLEADRDLWYYDFTFVVAFAITTIAALYFLMVRRLQAHPNRFAHKQQPFPCL